MAITKPGAIVAFLMLTLLGAAGNYFRYPIFFNIDFLFGSVFSMLALQWLGGPAGILAAVLSSVVTLALWNHPYAIVVMSCEVAVVWWLMSSKKMDLVLADAVYWCLLGMPLVLLFYCGVMDLPLSSTTITMLKQTINGITNALMARVIFMALAYRVNRADFAMRELLFNSLFVFVLIPTLFLIAHESQAERQEVDRRLRESLLVNAKKTNASLENWLHANLDRIGYAAELAGRRTIPATQAAIEILRESQPDFLRIGVLDDSAITVAYSPLIDDNGKSTLGLNFSDRRHIPQLKLARAPFLGDVLMARIGPPMPFAHVLAPVTSKGAYRGFVIGVLNLAKVSELLALNAPNGIDSALDYTLVDQNGLIIVSSKPGLKTMDQFTRAKGSMTPVADGIVQWVPEVVANIPVSEKWKDAIYIADSAVGKSSGWRLILEAPVSPYQASLYRKYVGVLARLGSVLLLALFMARWLSKVGVGALERLGAATLDLPGLATQQPVDWRRSPVRETQQLLDHFKQMARSLRDQFAKVNELNATLELRVTERTQQLNAILDNSNVGITLVVDRNVLWVNQRMAELFGYDRQEMSGCDTSKFYLSQQDFEGFGRVAYPVLERGQSYSGELEMRRSDASTFVASISGKAVYAGNPALGSIWVLDDITVRKQLEAKLRLAANVFSHAREGIIITDAAGSMVDVNQTFTDLTGYSRDEAIGNHPHMFKSRTQNSDAYRTMLQALADEGHWHGELWNRRKNGDEYAALITISAVRDGVGKVQHYVCLFSDISTIKQHQRQLEHAAHYDTLTGLPNRVFLLDRLKQSLLQSHRRGQSLAVAYLDLDGFKAINDTYGHAHGDALLIALAERMSTALRDGDTLARIGGDEFVAVLVDLAHANDSHVVLQRLLTAAGDPLVVKQQVMQVSASIGVTLYPQDGGDADLLIRHADQAMYVAKQAGKNRCQLFDTAQDAAIQTRHESLHHIRSALDHQQLVLHYQPKVNMATGRVTGAEALIRWQHPVRGLLPPGVFLPVIEGHPISVEVGEWVIATALAQMSAWHQQGLDLPVSVNIGARQLQQDGFAARLGELLAAQPDVRPECLQLEVLETSALEDIVKGGAAMHACQDLGVSFALDDFGTGYSSLTYLRRLPAEVLKIDQSFVRDMLVDPNDLAIVAGVIALAKAFGRQVIAEGVETAAHGAMLQSIGCALAQGYGIARPMSASDMPGWVESWHAAAVWTV